MQLVNEIGVWEAVTKYGEGDEPKAAGFRWNRDRKRWQAPTALAATRLAAHASTADRARLQAETGETIALARVEAEKVTAEVEASRATDAEIGIPAPVGLSYLGYQRAGIAYAMGRKDTLIADEMGLGKTIQALGVVNLDRAAHARESQDFREAAGFARDKIPCGRGPFGVLVVAPKIALRNWAREAEKWLVVPHSVAIWTAKEQAEADLVIVNYDVLKRPAVAKALRERMWDVAIFDEAHALKNDKAARTKACLGDKKAGTEAIPARRRLFLTGTPILNRPIELYPILRAMDLPEASSFFGFAKRYCDGHDTSFGFRADGASNLDELQTLLRRRVMVRRLKKDVLTELPAKRFAVVEFDADTPDLRRVVAAENKAQADAEANERELRAQVAAARKGGNSASLRVAIAALAEGKRAAFTEMSRLRHETAVAKVPQVVEHVAGLLDGSDESVLVFAHHRDVIDGIQSGLAEAGHEAAVITGDTSDDDRQRAQDDIQARRKRVFIGSMRACGVAITLTAASTVVFSEQDWTPGIMQQAEDRAHRIGQANSVLVQHLVVDGSLDATMAKTVSAKGGVIEAALDAEIEAPEVPEASAFEVAAVFNPLPPPVTEQEGATIAAPDISTESIAAVHAGLRVLAGMDSDGAREINGVGFSKMDSAFGHSVAARGALTPGQALICRKLIARYRRQLPDILVTVAMGEVAEAVPVIALKETETPAPVALADLVVATAPQVDPEAVTAPTEEVTISSQVPELEPVPVAKRGRGRPRLGDAPLSKSERNRRWRENNRIAALEIPAAIADRIRRLREERGLSNADLIAAALDALIVATPHDNHDTSTTLDA